MNGESTYNQQIGALCHLLENKLDSKNSDDYHITAILDIEGTTTALPFVTQVLFPYAESALSSFVFKMFEALEKGEESNDIAVFQKALAEANTERKQNLEAGENPSVSSDLTAESLVSLLKEKMAINSKVTYLKQIQGLIWRHGYENGEIKAHLFADTVPFLETMKKSLWQTENRSITLETSAEIYSSGSIAAQKLLFGHSQYGNLCAFVSNYHDPSTVGLKTESSSYKKLRTASKAALSSDTKSKRKMIYVFFTDSFAEIAAAHGVIDLCVFVERPLNNPYTTKQIDDLPSDVARISSFDQFTEALKHTIAPSSSTSTITKKTDDEIKRLLDEQVSDYCRESELKVFQ